MDRQERARVWKGEEDTLANYLLLGTGYTRQPRITDAYRAELVRQSGREQDADNHIKSVIIARANDLARSISSAGNDERLLIALEIANRAGHSAGSAESQEKLAQYLFNNLVRFLNESRWFAGEVAAANSLRSGFSNTRLSHLYQSRGLSSDSSILVDCALNKALHNIQKDGLLNSRLMRKAGIIGTGLDVIDKFGGRDLFPPQVTQPFLLIDSLLQLGLANAHDLQLSILDISTRVVRHVERSIEKTFDSQSYVLNLIHDSSLEWSEEAVRYWETCCQKISSSINPHTQRISHGICNRSVQVDEKWVRMLEPVDCNIVCNQPTLADEGDFDLLVATNVLCYYDSFQQTLALRNAAGMLRPGGLLLTTEALAGAEFTKMNLACSTYSQTSKSLGYTIFCYMRSS